jgi:hypothetical protein
VDKTAIFRLLASALAFIGVCCIDTGQAQMQDLAFGKYRLSAAFPCAPKREKRLAGKTELGTEIFMVSLGCDHGDHTYFLGVMQYPPDLMSAHSPDELLESYGHNTAAKKHVKIRTSQRMTHKGFPAVRYHVLDTRTPEKELIMMGVLVDQSMLTISVTARSGQLQPAKHASFADSLSIGGGR